MTMTPEIAALVREELAGLAAYQIPHPHGIRAKLHGNRGIAGCAHASVNNDRCIRQLLTHYPQVRGILHAES